jgi:hypothetical protein
MAVVPNMWPGFATGAATCLSFVIGDLNIQLVGILGLLAVGITLTASPVVYQTVENALAGAIAFAGSGGCGNLAVSNGVRDKGMGMRRYIPHITSPMSGEQEAVPSTGATFEPSDENMRRWRGWWKVANTEQAVTF